MKVHFGEPHLFLALNPISGLLNRIIDLRDAHIKLTRH